MFSLVHIVADNLLRGWPSKHSSCSLCVHPPSEPARTRFDFLLIATPPLPDRDLNSFHWTYIEYGKSLSQLEKLTEDLAFSGMSQPFPDFGSEMTGITDR